MPASETKTASIGQRVVISSGPFQGLAGVIVGFRDAKWMLQFPSFGAGTYVLIDPDFCSSATSS